MMLTIEEARHKLFKLFKVGESQTCPCCKQHVKLYRYKLNNRQVQQLLKLAQESDWVLGTDLIFSTVGDWRKYSFLRWWGLATESKGYYRITRLGREFLRRRTTIPKYIYLYNNTLHDTSTEQVFVEDANKEFFDYDELMKPFQGV
jgi:hypothetical protein|tara:strand:- start:68 stop:505 length:438 start_codon:yes stop_codon:yes gene_type:complete